MNRPLPRLTKLQGHIACIGAAILLGIPMWLVYKISPDAFIFLIAWIIVRPIYKLWREIEL